MNTPIEFNGRTALLGSMHGKEEVIGPILREALGIQLAVAAKLDTDQFGRFDGLIERPDNQYNTDRLKAKKVFELYPDVDLAIASEGAFYPHPDCPFITVNSEIVLLLDRKNDLEIAGRYFDLAPDAIEMTAKTIEEAQKIIASIGFPGTGVVLIGRPDPAAPPEVCKNARTMEMLDRGLRDFFSRMPEIRVQTDLRAHFYPRRMEHIRLAALELVKTIRSVCPQCHLPGLDVVDVVRGLPCEICHNPTRHVLAYTRECKKCGHRSEEKYPKGERFANPMYCDYCNP